jgi:hypothetical protein
MSLDTDRVYAGAPTRQVSFSFGDNKMPDKIKTDRLFIAFTCFESNIEKVCNDLRIILDEPNFGEIYKHDPRELPLKFPEQEYNPKTMGFSLWVPKTISNGCVFMPTLMDGWSSVTHIMANKYSHKCAKIRVSSRKDDYPICEFIYFCGDQKRIVRSMKDDPRGEFLEQGPPLKFEDVESYKKRFVKDKFSEDLLIRYLAQLGWDLKSESFWETDDSYYVMKK